MIEGTKRDLDLVVIGQRGTLGLSCEEAWIGRNNQSRQTSIGCPVPVMKIDILTYIRVAVQKDHK